MGSTVGQIPDSNRRWLQSPEGMDEAEIAWWSEYADVEERYCWVHTVSIQRRLRSQYIQRIARALPDDATVLEFGCGTGWLSLLLAEGGVPRIVGVDFSREQLRRAEDGRRVRGLEDRVQFVQIAPPLAGWTKELQGQRFDALIVHGVLHHLTTSEIDTFLEEFCHNAAAPDARVFMLEPIEINSTMNPRLRTGLEWVVNLLTALPLAGSHSGWRTVSARESAAGERIKARGRGIPPRGPSPKEMPFQPSELDSLPGLTLRSRRPVLCFSPQAARNLTLLGDSYPRVARLAEAPYLGLVRLLETLMLASGNIPQNVVFELLEYGVQRAQAASMPGSVPSPTPVRHT